MRTIVDLADNKNRVGALLILLFALAYLRQALNIPMDAAGADEVFNAKTLPVGLAVAAIVMSIAQLVLPAAANDGQRISLTVRGFQWRPTLLLILLTVVYTLVFAILGFLIASVLFLLAGFFVLGERRVLRGLAVSSGLVGFLWMMLTQVFGLYLDSGALLRLLTD